MSTHYKKFLRLLEHWPVDTTKPGRYVLEYDAIAHTQNVMNRFVFLRFDY